MNYCYVNIAGGLGNQIFMIAAGYAYAKRYGKKLIINDFNWSATQGNPPSTYKSTIFKNFEFGRIQTNATHITEKRENYDELPYVDGDVALSGYFQSLKYFEDCKDEFIDLLELPNISPITDKVAFHIRRGDYLRYAHIHHVCDSKYFENQFMRFDPKNVDVFTDSSEYVRNEFNHRKLNIITGNTELEDLILMSQYDRIVCSNSTFSWWASLLGVKKREIIVPNVWLIGRDCSDFYRSDMTIVST
jgi:hypothetical protein